MVCIIHEKRLKKKRSMRTYNKQDIMDTQLLLTKDLNSIQSAKGNQHMSWAIRKKRLKIYSIVYKKGLPSMILMIQKYGDLLNVKLKQHSILQFKWYGQAGKMIAQSILVQLVNHLSHCQVVNGLKDTNGIQLEEIFLKIQHYSIKERKNGKRHLIISNSYLHMRKEQVTTPPIPI